MIQRSTKKSIDLRATGDRSCICHRRLYMEDQFTYLWREFTLLGKNYTSIIPVRGDVTLPYHQRIFFQLAPAGKEEYM